MKRKEIYILIAILIVFLTIMHIKKFSTEIEDIITKYVKNDSIYIMNQIVDKTIKKTIYKEANNIIETNENDKTNVNFNNSKINKLTNEISYLLYDELIKKNKKENIYYISYGLLLNNHLLNNLGPKIPYSVKSLGNISTNSKIRIKEYGINNSLIEVVIFIKIDFEIILPFIEEIYTLEKEIILDSKIISDEIPLYYSNKS